MLHRRETKARRVDGEYGRLYGGAEGRNSRGTHGHTTTYTNSRAQHEHEYICITCNCHTATVTTWDQINRIEQNSDLASVHCEQMGGGLGDH